MLNTVPIRIALATYWFLIGTMGLISNMTATETGAAVGSGVGLAPDTSAGLINAFSFLDLALGLWTALGWRLRTCAVAQFLTVGAYTIGLTVAAPDIWLDPFGRLAKNIPILVLIWVWWRNDDQHPVA